MRILALPWRLHHLRNPRPERLNPMTDPTSHPCPGCGTATRPTLYACGRCWPRLPKALRDKILLGYRRRRANIPGAFGEHLDAMLAGAEWFRDNPR
jgi:hypothetical protein